jgi:hypothetical protein
MIQGLTVRDKAGIASAPVCFILRPAAGAPTPVQVLGREESHRRLEKARRAQWTKRFSDWVRVNPWGGGGVSPRNSLDLWTGEPLKPGARVFGTEFFEFGGATMEAQLVAPLSPLHQGAATLAWRLLSWTPLDGRPNVAQTGALNLSEAPGSCVTRFAFDTRPGHVYAFIGQLQGGPALFATIDLQLRRRPA